MILLEIIGTLINGESPCDAHKYWCPTPPRIEYHIPEENHNTNPFSNSTFVIGSSASASISYAITPTFYYPGFS